MRLQLASEVDILQQLHHDSLVSYLFMVNEGARFSVVRVGCGDYWSLHLDSSADSTPGWGWISCVLEGCARILRKAQDRGVRHGMLIHIRSWNCAGLETTECACCCQANPAPCMAYNNILQEGRTARTETHSLQTFLQILNPPLLSCTGVHLTCNRLWTGQAVASGVWWSSSSTWGRTLQGTLRTS